MSEKDESCKPEPYDLSDLPRAIGGCHCHCHRMPGVSHVMPCCGRTRFPFEPYDLNEE